jgi:predicted lipoprotein with Yx(FWY)xxD motif
MSHRLRIAFVTGLAATCGVAAAVFVVGPAAGRAKLTLHSARSSALNAYVVALPSGRTVYSRTRETTRHFLCTGSCAQIWPPVTVGSRSTQLVAGSGVRGTLGIVRRPDGRLQVTLAGRPLYRFSSDRRAGDASGEGIRGEGTGGGIWHAVRATAPRRTTTPPQTTPTMTSPTYTAAPTNTAPPTYTYPGY